MSNPLLPSYTCVIQICVAPVQAPEEWLKKVMEVSSLSVTLTERRQVQSSAQAGQQPLLQLPLVQIAALAPVMALLSNVAAVSHAEAFIDVLVEPVRAAVTAQQVHWLKSFAAAVPGILRSGGVLCDGLQ